MTNSPIALFVYNRPEHTRRTVKALQKNFLASESDLFVFCDGYKNHESRIENYEVRKYIKTITGFKSVKIIEREKNWGLAKSIISGVTEIMNQYGKVIVMEDDLESSPYFLKFMNDALEKYKDEERVMCVHGYLYPIKSRLPETFFLKHASSWGWGTWKRGWDLFQSDGAKLMEELKRKSILKKFDIDRAYNFSGMLERQIAGQTDSWAIRWNASCLVNDKLNLYPSISLIQNIGQDGSGAHGGKSERYKVALSNREIKVGNIIIEENKEAYAGLRHYYEGLKLSLYKKIIYKIKKLIPVKTKVRLLNFWPNIKKMARKLLGKIRGIKIVTPNPKLPNYYMFKPRFSAASTIVDVGCGYDADFSICMIKMFGLKAIGIDPTLKHQGGLSVLSKKMEGRFTHRPWAISEKNGKIVFNESVDNVSGSILENHQNLKSGAIKKYEVESISLKNLPRRLELEKIEYIKLDIEGAEYGLIDKLEKGDLAQYEQVFIEFHHHCLPHYSKTDTLQKVKKMESCGFKSFTIDNHDFLFYK